MILGRRSRGLGSRDMILGMNSGDRGSIGVGWLITCWTASLSSYSAVTSSPLLLGWTYLPVISHWLIVNLTWRKLTGKEESNLVEIYTRTNLLTFWEWLTASLWHCFFFPAANSGDTETSQLTKAGISVDRENGSSSTARPGMKDLLSFGWLHHPTLLQRILPHQKRRIQKNLSHLFHTFSYLEKIKKILPSKPKIKSLERKIETNTYHDHVGLPESPY